MSDRLGPYIYTVAQVTRPRGHRLSRAESTRKSLNFARQEYDEFPAELEQVIRGLSTEQLDDLYVDIARRIQEGGAKAVTYLAHLKLLGRPFVGGRLRLRTLAEPVTPEVPAPPPPAADVAETARKRVRNTQMPLFVLEPEQMTLGGNRG